MTETFHAGPNLGRLSDVTIIHGDCIEAMRELADDSIDAIVCDPPYGLGFMGKEWDALPPGLPWAQECLRVLKPGGHLLAFGGTRTWHRLAVAVEDAGFEIRDSIAWLYGSGFPKSLDVSKAIDKAAGATREVIGERRQRANSDASAVPMNASVGLVEKITAPATPEAEQWQGWGTALKPAHEPVVHGIKPYPDKAILDFIGSHLTALEESCRPDVRLAELSSAPTPADSHEARTASALASAAIQHADGSERLTLTGAVDDSSGLTDTSVSESMESTCWSIVTSWLNSWDEICEATSMSTTSTTTSQTTDLKTLWSYLSRITLEDMARNIQSQDSSPSLVDLVDSLFSAGALNSRSILLRTAIENATSEGRDPSPAFEPVVVGRKPIVGTVAANVLAHGTGALNIDACRIGGGQPRPAREGTGRNGAVYGAGLEGSLAVADTLAGRWPANVVLDESQAAALDEQSGYQKDGVAVNRNTDPGARKPSSVYGAYLNGSREDQGYGSGGGASRFFYCAKAPKKERPVTDDGTAHPTVKPLTLMRWLVRLVTPPGGTVLDPFAGSGTTVEAALLEGFRVIGIERETDYLPMIQQRIARSL